MVRRTSEVDVTYAADTSVPVERSKAEIERTLARYGASKFFSGWDADAAVVGFSMEDRLVQFRLPLPKPGDYARTPTGQHRSSSAADRAYEQSLRSRWRALLLVIKSKLESVESGIEVFEEAFLAQIVIGDGDGGSTTVAAAVRPLIADSYAGRSPRLALPETTGAGQ